VEESHASGTRQFLALIEIDRFEGLKRTIGYSAVARIIAALAEGVRVRMANLQTLRVGRDQIEITFLAESAKQARSLLEGVVAGVSRRIVMDGFGFDLAIRCGLADSGGLPLSDELVGLAERALGLAQRSGSRIAVAESVAAARAADRLSLMRALQQAIADDALTLHYQPKIRARSGTTASIEALVRWPRADGTLLPPDAFIPFAEETGDIRALTEWVIDRAVADRLRLTDAGWPLRIDINISGGLIADTAFTAALIARAAPAGHGAIGFELTETATIADPDRALVNLRRCAEAGIPLAIDDYGAGFSSLAYLQQLPITELKIDRSFIGRLATHQRDPLLVRSTIDLAHALEMEVTAEGVESVHALALLQVMGCDMVQGYHLSRPLDFDKLVDFLAAEPQRIAEEPVLRPSLPMRRRRSAR
jgi:diguanylate cyclase